MDKVSVAVSGGIDSLVSAFLLKEKGYNVSGIHFITGFENSETPETGPENIKKQIHTKIESISDQLSIKINIIDLSREFKKKVVDYFSGSYLSGKTPNPCLVCNPKIKFGKLLEEIRKENINFLATGHYARIQKDKCSISHLLKGIDPKKDQSYFLSFLKQDQLKHILFPLGQLHKTGTRKIAEENGLTPPTKSESQDICFISGTSYSDFLVKYTGVTVKPGEITDAQGNLIGQHPGLHHFTIGQRKGINCPAKEPYYVLKTDIKHNKLIVGSKTDLFKKECAVSDLNWIHEIPENGSDIKVKIRYSHRETLSKIYLEKQTARIVFNEPQPSVTPGQGAVFYKDDEVLGAGFIK